MLLMYQCLLDSEIMVNYCKGLNKLKERVEDKQSRTYEVWYASNDCNLNFHGSVPKMEGIGAKNVFNSSITKR